MRRVDLYRVLLLRVRVLAVHGCRAGAAVVCAGMPGRSRQLAHADE